MDKPALQQRPDESRRLLNGWKEIAAYMGRGVRTVQRWELLGLPVHRPNGRLRSAVFASSSDLDAWLAATPHRDLDVVADLRARVKELEAENALLRQQLATLAEPQRTVRRPSMVRQARVS